MHIGGQLACTLLIGATVCIAAASGAPNNPLIGSWRWDNEKTLQNFHVSTQGTKEYMNSAAKAKQFVQSVAARIRSNMVLTYRDNEYDEVITLFVEVKVGDFIYRDYFTRLRKIRVAPIRDPTLWRLYPHASAETEL
jgi:hypothetical protein